MQHLDEGTIHAWLDGELSAAEREAAEAHVAECAQCAAAVAEARGFIAASTRILTALDSVPGGVLPATSTGSGAARPAARRPFIVRRAWMAAAAVLVLSTVTVIAIRPGSDAGQLRVAAVARDDKELAASAAPAEEKTAPAAAGGAAQNAVSDNAPAPMQSRKAAPVAAPKPVDQDERLKSRLEAERQLTRVRPPVAMADAAVPARAPEPSASMDKMSPQPAAPPAPSTFAKDEAAKRSDVASLEDTSSTRRKVALDRLAVTAAGTTALSGKLGAAAAPDSATADSAAPTLLSRNTIHVGVDTVVTSIYSVRGVSVSLIDHSHARDEAGRLRLRGSVSEMSPKSQAAAAAVNNMSWFDSTGHALTLRGPLTTEQLEQLRTALFGPTR